MADTTKKKTYYITTPIYYPSAKLHIGHTYCTSIADTIARFKRRDGYQVRFLTGSDEHGQKIQRAAEGLGITPLEYTTKIVDGFRNLWRKMNISNDDFIRTTEPRHEKVVQYLFQKAYDKGDIYKSKYGGWYCTPCETFWTEQKLGENHTCPDCGRPVERVEEESYFFRMNKYADRWLKFIEDNPDFIQPESRRNEMIQFVKQGLEDLCVSRTSFDWGIKVPFDPKHVVYVWFDALLNYLTAIGYKADEEMFRKYWPADLHLVGKEIVRFHSIIWPIMLMAMGEAIPKKVYGHGWLVVDGSKMSKRDKAKVDISRISRFGLMQISRQKMGAPTAKGSYITCAHCQGRGVVRSVETQALYYLRRIQTGIIRKKVARVECRLPLEVAQYLLNRKKEELAALERQHNATIEISVRPDMLPSEHEMDFLGAESAA